MKRIAVGAMAAVAALMMTGTAMANDGGYGCQQMREQGCACGAEHRACQDRHAFTEGRHDRREAHRAERQQRREARRAERQQRRDAGHERRTARNG